MLLIVDNLHCGSEARKDIHRNVSLMMRDDVRLGFLYPGFAAENDYDLLAGRIGAWVHAEVVHTTVGEDAHRVDALLDLGSPPRLLEGTERLRRVGVAAAMWACTSGSFVYGWEGARRQVGELEQRLGAPVSSTSLAFVAAVERLGVGRVAVAATYPQEVAERFVDFLGEADVDVVHLGAADIVTAEEVGTLGREPVVDLVRRHDHPAAEAVLVPDTALRTAPWLEELEATVGKPVLTANPVTMWEALRLAGRPVEVDGVGSVFRREPLGPPSADPQIK
jgi:maleate cis-trans isomerase